MKKVVIRQVDNGYVVKITPQTANMFKARYDSTNDYVFTTLREASEFIKTYFGSTIEEDPV
jgi:hypothetical protein